MTLTISVRDYRGIERADIEAAPIALVAGTNGQGKSCLAQAVRAVLTGVAIPIPGVAKKDAKLLVRDGADKGSVSASNGEGLMVVEWPKCDIKGKEGNPASSDWAAGLRHLFDLSDKERPDVLAGYIDSAPSRDDLAAAMAGVGYGDKAVDQTWESVSAPGGWDSTHKKARDYGTRLKGQWEGVTGERWGAKKGAEWVPEGFGEESESATIETLEARLEQDKAAYDKVVGQRAVASHNVAELEAVVAELPALEKQAKAALKLKDERHEDMRSMSVKVAPKIPAEPMQCPSCETPLKVDQGSLVEVGEAPTASDIKDAKAALEEFNAQKDRVNKAFEEAYQDHHRAEELACSARRAKLELESLRKQGGTATDEDVEKARAIVAETQTQIDLKRALEQATTLHEQITKNAALVDILAPDGLRRRKLAAGLDLFNSRLAGLCEAAGWPAVRLDESLQPHYGQRPVWAVSASEQWRARAVVQITMALLDNSDAVVIDEADILDARGRNELFRLLSNIRKSMSVVVCMTINKPDLVPDLEQADMGRSYWVANGIVEAISQQEEEAA